jgi:hypothetical protein
MREAVAVKAEASLMGLDKQGNYCPYPKIKWIVDTPTDMRCDICTCSVLKFRAPGKQSDSTPVVLPCGHVFGLNCLDAYLEDEDVKKAPKCPTCRLDLKYELCPHNVNYRVINTDTVHRLPPTIVEGGAIPDQCLDCSVETNRVVAAECLKAFKRSFEKAREKYRETGKDSDKALMLFYKKRLENSYVNEFVQMPLRHAFECW